MTKQEHARYTSPAYMSKYTTRGLAVKMALNSHNRGKVKILMLEDGTYGVAPNKVANKLIAAGYEEMHYNLSDI